MSCGVRLAARRLTPSRSVAKRDAVGMRVGVKRGRSGPLRRLPPREARARDLSRSDSVPVVSHAALGLAATGVLVYRARRSCD